MYIIEVTPETIREVMEWYGESLSELPCDNYEWAFEDYIKARFPVRYAQWKDVNSQYGGYSPVLFDWSNNRMEGRITEEEHDRILADFCNLDVRANEQIQRLLDGM